MNEIHQAILRLFRPFTFVVWGFILLAASWVISVGAEGTTSSFFVRHLFAFTFVSWIAGVILLVRVTLRRHRHERTMFD